MSALARQDEPRDAGPGAALASRIRAGQRTALARAITLLESTRADRAALGQTVLTALLPHTGAAVRVGVTGVPGVGKSTFIEALGTMLITQGHRVAVLTVDPSSERTGGSILGDKTRMPRLAADPNAFVRPSPSSGVLGGVARMTRETMLLCEAAGYDVVLVETVGVGQSETIVAGMVDTFLVLALPGAGDELQGIKKGIVELADLVVVTKADGENKLRAQQAARHWSAALHIIAAADAAWQPPVLTISAVAGHGLEAVWRRVLDHRASLERTGELEAKRRGQALAWFKSLLAAQLRASLERVPEIARAIVAAEACVARGTMAPGTAVTHVADVIARRLGEH